MADAPNQDQVSRAPVGGIYASPGTDSETLNLHDMIGDILENRWLVLGIATLVFLIGIALAITATPIYEADVLLQIEAKQSGLTELQISELYSGEIPVTAEIEILRSRSVLGAVVDNLKLAVVARTRRIRAVRRRRQATVPDAT